MHWNIPEEFAVAADNFNRRNTSRQLIDCATITALTAEPHLNNVPPILSDIAEKLISLAR